ncbi:FAD-dependent oxidoreductase [Streptomyces sp. NPDC059928]|uniref:FAD-dependent oxidoreductase n=1 Tax=unclassified Streptomyces TaxID=2593676 RepID=UPI00365BF972
MADTASVPGAENHAYTLSSAQDAEVMAGRLAGLGSGTVVVGGRGLTDIESAAEIAERYPQLDVVLVGRGEPGAAMNPKARVYLRAVLDRQVVRVRSGVEVMKVRPGVVELVGGEGVAADVVVWAGGRRESPLAAAAGLAVDERGRVVTDAAHNVANPDKLRGVTRGTAHNSAHGDAAHREAPCRRRMVPSQGPYGSGGPLRRDTQVDDAGSRNLARRRRDARRLVARLLASPGATVSALPGRCGGGPERRRPCRWRSRASRRPDTACRR